MKLKNLKYAALCTVAATALVSASDAMAQSQTVTGTVTAVVDNSFVLAETTPMHFGTVVAICDTAGANQATLILSTAGAGAITNALPAQFVNVDTTARTQGVFDVTGAAPSTPLNVTLGAAVDLTCGACLGTPPALLLSALTDDTGGGTVTTDALGAATIQTGATISTAATCGTQYEDGTYVGSFDITVAY